MEKAVYEESEAISERGGVLSAMDTMCQRGKIQEESLYYEHKKHDGSLPLVGVNTFLPKEHAGEVPTEIELIRSTEAEKGQQVANTVASRPTAAGWRRKAGPPTPTLLRMKRLPARCTTGTGWRIFRTRRGDGGRCSQRWLKRRRPTHWGRSVMPCMRWAGSIGGICSGVSDDSHCEPHSC